MEWKKPSEELSRLLESVAPLSGVEKKKMFGCPCYFVHGNMAFGVFADFLFFRLDEKTREKMFAGNGSSFEPQPGRRMKEYVQLSRDNVGTVAELQKIIGQSIAYTKKLPAKRKTK
jgi:TfoX/Sxy family transcriptional regulator of competence genes